MPAVQICVSFIGTCTRDMLDQGVIMPLEIRALPTCDMNGTAGAACGSQGVHIELGKHGAGCMVGARCHFEAISSSKTLQSDHRRYSSEYWGCVHFSTLKDQRNMTAVVFCRVEYYLNSCQ